MIHVLVFYKSMIFHKIFAVANMHITFGAIVVGFGVLSLLAVGCLPLVCTHDTCSLLLVIISEMCFPFSQVKSWLEGEV